MQRKVAMVSGDCIVVTARKRSCGEVLFLITFVCSQRGLHYGGGGGGLGIHCFVKKLHKKPPGFFLDTNCIEIVLNATSQVWLFENTFLFIFWRAKYFNVPWQVSCGTVASRHIPTLDCLGLRGWARHTLPHGMVYILMVYIPWQVSCGTVASRHIPTLDCLGLRGWARHTLPHGMVWNVRDK